MHPLIQQLHDVYAYPEITLDTHDAFIRQSGITVLFFPGNPARFRDTTDVAVVLPELVKAFNGALHPGVVAPGAGKTLQQHYQFELWPALVFLRDGGYLGSISRIRNWSEYLQEISELIVGEAQPIKDITMVPAVNL